MSFSLPCGERRDRLTSPAQVLWTYLRTWFLFDASLVTLDILTLVALSWNPRTISNKPTGEAFQQEQHGSRGAVPTRRRT